MAERRRGCRSWESCTGLCRSCTTERLVWRSALGRGIVDLVTTIRVWEPSLIRVRLRPTTLKRQSGSRVLPEAWWWDGRRDARRPVCRARAHWSSFVMARAGATPEGSGCASTVGARRSRNAEPIECGHVREASECMGASRGRTHPDNPFVHRPERSGSLRGPCPRAARACGSGSHSEDNAGRA